MKKFFIILFIFFITIIPGCTPKTFTNTWRRIYGWSGSETINHIEKTKDGNYILGGMTNSKGFGQDDFYLLKIDNFGNILWDFVYGGENDDTLNCIKETSDNGFICIGESYSFGIANNKDLYIFKLNSKNEILWAKNLGGKDVDGGRWVEETSDSGYIAVGWTRSFGSGASDFYIIKLDSSGNLTWTKTWGGSAFDEAYSVIETEDKGYLVVGYTISFGKGAKDVAIVKLDDKGNICWYKTYGGSKDDVGVSIKKLEDGNYIVVGYTSSFGNGNTDVYVIKIDNNGELIWEKIFGGEQDDIANDSIITSDGNLLIVGWTKSFSAKDRDIYILKISKDGNLIWQKNYGGENMDEGRTVVETNDKGYIVAGMTLSFDSLGSDIIILKFDQQGKI